MLKALKLFVDRIVCWAKKVFFLSKLCNAVNLRHFEIKLPVGTHKAHTHVHSSVFATRDRCYGFKIFSPKNMAKMMVFSCKKLIITMFLFRKTPILSPTMAKIAENGENRRKL
jgi:hypothetical protein